MTAEKILTILYEQWADQNGVEIELKIERRGKNDNDKNLKEIA